MTGRRWYKCGTALAEEIRSTRLSGGEVAVWYIGQCGFVFKSCEATVVIDAVLTDLTNPDGSTRRHYPPPFEPACLGADYWLCTHGHADHMALPTLTAAARAWPEAKFILPAGCVSALEEAGVAPERIIPARDGEALNLPGLTLRPVSAAHPEHATDPNGGDLALCVGLRMGGVELLHLGDTYLTDRLLASLKALPAPQLYFAPVNGGDYFRTARNCIGNVNPLEAARLGVMLGADLCVPAHFDMVYGNTADPLHFVQALWQENPAAKWHIPALGERMLYRL